MTALARCCLALLVVAVGASAAAESAIEGRWATYDEATGQQRAVIEIVREGSRMRGRIAELSTAPDEDANPVCEKCSGGDRGRPLRGMAILDVGADAIDGSFRGTVLDPEEGRTYRVVVTLSSDGRRLQLRGFVGIELFGRSETWRREQ